MTYRELYAQYAPDLKQVETIHIRHCPTFMRSLGEKIPCRLRLGCPFPWGPSQDELVIARCAKCWDQEVKEDAVNDAERNQIQQQGVPAG